MNTNCIDITFLSMPQRDLAVLQVYLQGVGSKVFREVAEGKAEVAIFDYDYPASRSHWELFSQTYGRPCIAFSAEELNLPNTTWVSKPVKIAALAEAAAKLRIQLSSNQQVAATTPSRTVEEPRPTPTVSPVVSSAPKPQPETPVQSETSNSSAADNWVNVREDKKKSPVLIWAVGGVAIVAGLWFFMRPSADQSQQVAESSSAPIGQPASTSNNTADKLRSAVDTSVTQYQTKSASEKSFISAQLDNMNNRGSSVVDDVKSKLDSMMGDQKALAEYNQAVYNKVQIAADAPSEKSEAAATEKDTRSKLESLVGAALTEQPSGSTFVSSIKSESKAHEAEMRTITVIPGDTLSAIAQRAYGDYTLYPKIFEANPRTLTSPNHIFPGQVLRVPL